MSSNPTSSYPPPLSHMTPSVRFAALSDPIKHFDGLDHTYPPEKILAHLSTRVTFQLGSQPTDIQSYLTWHSRRIPLLYCSLTRTASNWFDRLPQVYKDDWSSFLQIFKKQFYSQKHAYHAQIEALSLVKKDNENVRHYALKVGTLVKQGWYIEYPSTFNLKCNEIFTRVLPKKLKDFANKRQVKHISSSLKPSIPFHTLVNMVDSEDITLEKIETQELSLEINNLSDTFQQNTTIQDTPAETPQIQEVDPNKKSKPQFKKYCSFCHKNNHSVSTYNSNAYCRTSRDTRYRPRSYSRSHSRPRYNDKSYPPKYSSNYDRTRSRYDKHYNQSPHKSYSSASHPYYNSTSSRSPSKYYPHSRERSSSYNNASFKRYNSPYRPPNHVMIATVVDHIQTQKTTLISNINLLSILLTQLQHLFKATLLQNPNLKSICTILLLLHHNILHSPLNMLTLLHLQLGLLIYTFANPLKILRSLPN